MSQGYNRHLKKIQYIICSFKYILDGISLYKYNTYKHISKTFQVKL